MIYAYRDPVARMGETLKLQRDHKPWVEFFRLHIKSGMPCGFAAYNVRHDGAAFVMEMQMRQLVREYMVCYFMAPAYLTLGYTSHIST